MKDAHQLADALGRAIATFDPAILQEIYADDISVWHGATGQAMGKADNIGMLSALFSISSRLEYVDVKRHDIADGVVQQHCLVGTLDDGVELAGLNACLILKIAAGKIVAIDEYFDSRTFDPVWTRLAALSAAEV